MKERRQKEIELLVARRQHMTMDELCRTFDVSLNTMRADVAALVRAGAIKKVYGGVETLQSRPVPMFESRLEDSREEKQRIAQAAAQIAQAGEILYLDAGTTAMHLIDFLPPQPFTVITASLYVIGQAAVRPEINLVVLPGPLNRRTNALLDAGTSEYLAHCQIDRAFLGTTGIAANGWLSVSSYAEYEVKRIAVRQSRRHYLLADAKKYGVSNLMAYAEAREMDAVYTDTAMDMGFCAYCDANRLELHRV